ncbi:MAG TPA: response regulator transcription factor [Vicinamibacterales bacterium]|nr:response regulator transcription factor [Acidobacteriota bacterium]HOC19732.1 response regulator transcription factor [Vicinamibacterales bacterium]
MAARPIRVLIADDHRMFREAVRAMLEPEPDIAVAGEAGTVAETLQMVGRVPADVLLLDLALPDGHGLDVLSALAREGSPIHPIVVSASTDRQDVVRAIKAGARGVVLKDSHPDRLVEAIRQVASGQLWFGHQRLADLLDSLRQPGPAPGERPLDTLTRRERDIVAAIVQGASNKDISQQFGLRESTVKNHLTHIFDKLGVANRLELALFAVQHNLFEGSGR